MRRRAKPETALINAAVKWLAYQGCLVWRQNQGGVKIENRFVRFTHGIKGISDIVGITPSGRFLAAEAKIKPNKLTRDQAWFLDRVRALGGAAIVFYNLEELEEKLRKERGR